MVLALTALAAAATATHPGTNGKLLFERPTRGGADLFSVGADGAGLARITGLKGVEGDASWSPDGSRVAFVRGKNPEGGPFEIWSVNGDGSGLRRLTRHRGFSIAPAWSPDGTKIVYATDAGVPPPNENTPPRQRLHVVNADGTGDRQLSRNPRRIGFADPQWSPDGTSIAFAVLKSGRRFPQGFDCSIALIDADDGGNLRQLTPRGGPDELNPNWSPDGAKIAFERNRLFDVRQSDIWTMNADGSSKTQLTGTRVYETYPAFSPDGTRIAFSSDRDNRNLSRRRLERGFELYTMAADGTDVVRVTNNRRPDLFPDWQPLP